MVHGSRSCFALSACSFGMTSALCSVVPSVRSMTCASRSGDAPARSESKAKRMPSHRFVPLPKLTSLRRASAVLCPSSVISVRGSTSTASRQKVTKDTRSFGPSVRTIVRAACLATSSIESPLLSTAPPAVWTFASMLMDHEMSMTQHMSTGTCSFPPGVLTETSAVRSAALPSSTCPGVTESWIAPSSCAMAAAVWALPQLG
mmetsp:Transcript_38491/g.99476  ORF Transcript_38491/g.99476 Transcript_38491/m.99476 type:complete len:203 (+) Transcript_38491:1492-2100(+)